MRDPRASFARADDALQARLAGVLEPRAADARQSVTRDAHLSERRHPNEARASDSATTVHERGLGCVCRQ